MIEPKVEALIQATGIEFRIGGSRAFYVPAHDYVQVPPPQAYFEPINWHRTALHELGHASGHASRLGRDLIRDSLSYQGRQQSDGFARAVLCCAHTSRPELIGRETHVPSPNPQLIYPGQWRKYPRGSPAGTGAVSPH